MNAGPCRLPDGGAIDRTRPIRFSFDGWRYEGFAGDTLASALLANGVRLVARSFKYHRPRGVLSAGVEEPNALVELRQGARREPNIPATQIELFDGLSAASQNRWPSLQADIGAVNSLFARFLPAGFYYKTFMWPASFWPHYERFIRAAAGLGRAPREADPDSYDRMAAHCDVLVIGAGPAGLAAATAAAETGARVVLVDENPRPGGRLRFDAETVEGQPGARWAAARWADLAGRANVRVLSRTTAFGLYDQNLAACVERVQDHCAISDPNRPRQRLWRIRAGRIVLATGAIEQPLVFADNDRPGIMLAGAVRAYANHYGVLAGRRALIATNNDDGYRTALDLAAHGAEVAAIVDLRAAGGALAERAAEAGIAVLPSHGIRRVLGRRQVRGARIGPLAGGLETAMAVDLIAMAGGWAPNVQLWGQAGGRALFDPALGALRAADGPAGRQIVGAAAGAFDLRACLYSGHAAGGGGGSEAPDWGVAPAPEAPPLAGRVLAGRGKRFVDFQDDVTAQDVGLAAREGYRSVEHLKRYTTLGMGTDQGKTGNLAGLEVLAAARAADPPSLGHTTFRPPYAPVSLGALAGAEVGPKIAPVRRSPMQLWHERAGAAWIDAGLWLRPHYYPHAGEDVDAAAARETVATRGGVGLCDVTTLGKIDIQGPDAAAFLNRIYTNGWSTLPVGKARYGLMLREDGLVFDDGTTSRLGEEHYVMTTTTANAVPAMALLEYYLQVEWPDLRVAVASVTEQWAAIAVAGPRSRDLLRPLIDIDIGAEAFAFMAAAACHCAGYPARLFRISFSGELAFEVNVPADYGEAVWQALMQAGEPLGVVPYGMEALGTMRIEKGHVAGPEINGQTTAADLGLGRMQSTKKEFVGRRLSDRPGLVEADRQQLVGLVPRDGKSWIPAGAQIIEAANRPPPVPMPMLGHVTSIAYSPELGMPIALALLSGGLSREGEALYAAFPLRGETVPVRVVSPHFVDPEGERMHG